MKFNREKHSPSMGVLIVPIPSRVAFCGGQVAGDVGGGMMFVNIFACVDNTMSGFHFLQVYGTAPIYLDAALMEKVPWTVDVATFFGIAIRNFTKGILNP